MWLLRLNKRPLNNDWKTVIAITKCLDWARVHLPGLASITGEKYNPCQNLAPKNEDEKEHLASGDTAAVNAMGPMQDGTLWQRLDVFCPGRIPIKRLSSISPQQMGGEEEEDLYSPELSLRSSMAPAADFLFFAKGYAWVPVHKVDRALGKSPGLSLTTRWSFCLQNSLIVSVRGSPRGHRSPGLPNKDYGLRTET